MPISSSITLIGHAHATTCFYLPTPPIIPHTWQHTDDKAIEALITLNGNHWRKILTIMAKLSTRTNEWKNYRDHGLLKSDEQILIGAKLLSAHAKQHIIVGAVSAANLSLTPNCSQFDSLDDAGKIYHNHDGIFITPYLDYRQFPNALIDQLRPHLCE